MKRTISDRLAWGFRILVKDGSMGGGSALRSAFHGNHIEPYVPSKVRLT